jgi:von Willebrand factor type D domain
MKYTKALSTLLALSACTIDAKKPKNECGVDCDFDSDCASGLLCADEHEKELAAAGLDKQKAYCGPKGASNLDVCYDPAKLGKVANIPVPYSPPSPLIGLCQADCDLDIDCANGLWCADEHTSELRAAGLDGRLADCAVSGVSSIHEVCFDPSILKTNGGGGGDPHFRTFDGTKYSYHGQCDLVMARQSSFSSGLGLDLHIRTKIVTDWSLISNAALRIGDDTFELANDGSYYFNGAKNVAMPIHLAGLYEVSSNVETIDALTNQRHYTISLGPNEKITMTLFKDMVGVTVDAYFFESEGLLGIHGKTGMVGRDHETVFQESNDMGSEWQVRDDEPMLFHNIDLPQYPQQCILPVQSTTSRRLQEANRNLAAGACSSVSSEMFDFCVQDVIRTGDVQMAQNYITGYGF